MTQLKSPFRYDYVGSFLRPAAVKEARAKFAKNEITKEQLTEVENEEIKKLVEKQKDTVQQVHSRHGWPMWNGSYRDKRVS